MDNPVGSLAFSDLDRWTEKERRWKEGDHDEAISVTDLCRPVFLMHKVGMHTVSDAMFVYEFCKSSFKPFSPF
jgi:hypothetical protein